METHRVGLDRLFVQLSTDQLRTVLPRLMATLGLELTPERAVEFHRGCTQLENDDDLLLELTATHHGQRLPLVLDFFRNENAPDELLVMGPAAIVGLARKELEVMVEPPMMRLIPA